MTTPIQPPSSPAPADNSGEVRAIEMTVAATAIVNQIQASFGTFATHPFAKAALNYAPLLLLKPTSQGTGVGATLGNPKVFAAAAITGLTVAHQIMAARGEKIMAGIQITRAQPEVEPGTTQKVLASAFDADGKNVLGKRITYRSSAPHVAEVDEYGVVRALEEGHATITAQCEEMEDLVSVKVVRHPGAPNQPPRGPRE
jgi:hypothetical protein